ncbi:MAG: hypothetical protein ACXWB4_02085 [Kaistella sp.]
MTHKVRLLGIGLFLFSLLYSCNEKEIKEDAVSDISKNGSVETVVSVEHSDSVDILVTKHKIWNKNYLAKEIITRDTIPALGDTLITVTKDGNEIQQTSKKDYEFYITVQ